MRVLLCSVFILTVVRGLVLDTHYCEGVGDSKCTIEEIRVDPCSSKKSCRIKKGTQAGISFDFTPKFSAEKLKTSVAWVNGAQELDFAGLDKNACAYTKCPAEEGVNQTYSYSLPIGKKLPKGSYPLKWTMYDENDPTNLCCFNFNIRIVS